MSCFSGSCALGLVTSVNIDELNRRSEASKHYNPPHSCTYLCFTGVVAVSLAHVATNNPDATAATGVSELVTLTAFEASRPMFTQGPSYKEARSGLNSKYQYNNTPVAPASSIFSGRPVLGLGPTSLGSYAIHVEHVARAEACHHRQASACLRGCRHAQQDAC